MDAKVFPVPRGDAEWRRTRSSAVAGCACGQRATGQGDGRTV